MSDITVLLSLYFQRKLDPESESQIESWIKASPENRETAEEICRMEQYLNTVAVAKSKNEADILNLSRASRHPRYRLNNAVGWISAAASLIILLATGLWIKGRESDSPSSVILSGTQEVKEVMLPDGSQVWLNSNSKLTYPKEFSRKHRTVQLEGEAYFDVTHEPDRPFYVNAGDLSVKVLGTQFDVEAYVGQAPVFHTTLVEGTVEMRYPHSGQVQTCTLSPGQRFSYEPESNSAKVSYADVKSLTSWKTGTIILDHTPLRDVLQMIGNTYSVRFIINNQEKMNESCSGSFVSQPIESILSTIESATGLHFKRSDNPSSDVVSFIVY